MSNIKKLPPHMMESEQGDQHYPVYTESNQSVTGVISKTLFDIIADIGDNIATIVFRHNSGELITTYTLNSDLITTEKTTVKIERGVVFAGSGTLTNSGIVIEELPSIEQGDFGGKMYGIQPYVQDVVSDVVLEASNSRKYNGRVFNVKGSLRGRVTINLPIVYIQEGYQITAMLGGTSIVNDDVQWTASGSGTGEYYLEASSGGTYGFSDNSPISVYADWGKLTSGTLGSLAAGNWGYGDNDSLGYSTIYVRLSDDSDPDTKSSAFLKAVPDVWIVPPTGYVIMPYCTAIDTSLRAPLDSNLGDQVTLIVNDMSLKMCSIKAETGTWRTE